MKHLSILIILLLSMCAMSMRCTSNGATISGGAEYEKEIVPGVKVNLGFTFKVTIGANGEEQLTVNNPFANTGEGCIIFEDGNGNQVGSPIPCQIPPGGSVTVPVPDGAKTHRIGNGDDCVERGAGGVVIGPLSYISPQKLTKRFSVGGLIRMDGGIKQEHCINASSSDASAFSRTVENITDFGYQNDLRSLIERGVKGVEVCLTEVNLVGGYDIELTLAGNGQFTNAEVWINGTRVALFQDSYQPPVIGTGWDACSFLLPAALPEWDYDSTSGAFWTNDIEIYFTKQGDSAAYKLSREITLESE